MPNLRDELAEDAAKEVKEKTQEQLEVEQQIADFKAIAAIAEQDGGKLIIQTVEKDVLSSIERLISLETATDTELRIAAMKLRVNLAMWRTLKRAPENQRLAEEELLKILE